MATLDSPSLATASGAVPTREVLVYRPPAFHRTDRQNMFVVVLPGSGGREGSFYVNHVVPESQVPEIAPVTSGRYEDSTIDDLIPVIEDQLLERRVRR